MKGKSLYRLISLILLFACFACPLFARDWFVSAAKGSGKKGTIASPAKDLGNISSQLVPGDVVRIAGGVYVGKGENGFDIINVPISIIGGYSDDFSTRDPWGKYRTVLTGNNMTKNFDNSPRIFIELSKYKEKMMPEIVIDGLIIDRGDQNQYKTKDNLMIVRMANNSTGAMPTIDAGALVIKASQTGNFDGTWKITVKNNIILNCAPTMGNLAVFAYSGSKVSITNNAVINCTGTGIYAGSLWKGSDVKNAPQFTIENNTVLFIWKYDAYVQAFSGVGYACDPEVVAHVSKNIFAFNDRIGIMKAGSWPLLLKDNIILCNIDTDYYETYTDTKIKLADILDEAETLDADSDNNTATRFTTPISKSWLENYGKRILIDRNAVEAEISAQKTKANELRSMLGLPACADDIKADSPIWLHRLSLDDAVKTAETFLSGSLGSSKTLIK